MEKAKSTWVVYIIEAKNGALYTGITTNLKRRLVEHLTQKKGARFFRTSPPSRVVFQERHESRSSATKRELELKRLSKNQKLALVKG